MHTLRDKERTIRHRVRVPVAELLVLNYDPDPRALISGDLNLHA